MALASTSAAAACGGTAAAACVVGAGHERPGLKSTVCLNTRSVGRAFGLKSSVNRVTCAHKITLRTPTGEQVFECEDDTYILDAAESAGLDLPYSCRAGACCSCAGKMVSGEVDQNEGSFLDEEQKEKGFLLMCVAYPLGDCVIETHKEDDVSS